MGTYYFQITPKIETYEVEAGATYQMPDNGKYATKISRLISYSDKVWYQDNKGLTTVLKDLITDQIYDILTEETSKEFMWVKLQAKELQGYA